MAVDQRIYLFETFDGKKIIGLVCGVDSDSARQRVERWLQKRLKSDNALVTQLSWYRHQSCNHERPRTASRFSCEICSRTLWEAVVADQPDSVRAQIEQALAIPKAMLRYLVVGDEVAEDEE